MLFWLIAFPLYISRRPQLREAGRRRGDAQMSGVPLPRPSNGLFLGGIVGCLCFEALLGLPLLAEAASPKLPECASSDVTTIGNQLLTETPALKAFEIAADWHTAGEVRMRSEPPRRICRVMIKSAAGSEAIYYAVEWQQKENKIIFVQLLGAADDGR